MWNKRMAREGVVVPRDPLTIYRSIFHPTPPLLNSPHNTPVIEEGNKYKKKNCHKQQLVIKENWSQTLAKINILPNWKYVFEIRRQRLILMNKKLSFVLEFARCQNVTTHRLLWQPKPPICLIKLQQGANSYIMTIWRSKDYFRRR